MPTEGKGPPDTGNSISSLGGEKEAPVFQNILQHHHQQVRLKVKGLELCALRCEPGFSNWGPPVHSGKVSEYAVLSLDPVHT